MATTNSLAGDLETTSYDTSISFDGGYCALTSKELNTNAIIDSVKSSEAGGNAVFIGTTRNTFQEKEVTLLEYQAYTKLAITTMKSIAQQALNKNKDHPSKRIIRVAIEHRLGIVPVREPSIVIAVSAPHRRQAFEICEWILEEVKLKAQIWKREHYEGEPEENAQWKANLPG